jgi:hypothetical protein
MAHKQEHIMNKKFIDEIHPALCRYYVANFGNSISNLSLWRFNCMECVSIPELKKVYDKFDCEQNNESMVIDAFEELAAKGYLNKLDWGYNLSEVGLKLGLQGKVSLTLVFLNKNPGIAIIVSVLALSVSICALFLSWSKP